MSAVYFFAGLQFAYLLLLGLPIAICLTKRDGQLGAIGWVLLAPALGATAYLSLGTALHSIGFRFLFVYLGMLAVALVACLIVGARSSRLWSGAARGAGVTLLGAGAALLLNSADYNFAGLDYFPLVNDDTFVYLGLVDQIRGAGWVTPRIAYAAGLVPLVESAVDIRIPGVILVADFADAFALETHTAFLLTQRVAIMVIALGAAGVVSLVTRSLMATLLCFMSLVLGNVLLHQILQQFNSSTVGTMVAPVIIAASIWALRAERSESEALAGCGLAGWACGTMAMASVEAHPFYLIVVGGMAACVVAAERNWIKALKGAIVFIALYVASSIVLLTKLLPTLIAQFAAAGGGHPGDWIANPAFVMQAMGITLTRSDRLQDYGLVSRIAAFTVAATLMVALFTLIWHAFRSRARTDVAKSDLTALAAMAAIVWCLQIGLYLRGSGYALLKLTDYFAFYGAVLVSVAYVLLGLNRHRAITAAFAALTMVYGVVAFLEKIPLLQRYADLTYLMPLPADYRLNANVGQKVIAPDVASDILNLFLYINRNEPVNIWFDQAETNRFRALSTASPELIARMPWIRPPSVNLADITYPQFTGVLPSITSAPGQTHVLQTDPDWLPAGFHPSGVVWRWLSRSGSFMVFGPVPAEQYDLQIDLAAGPDLRPDNQIEIRILGQILLKITPDQLPGRFFAPLPKVAPEGAMGELHILGGAAGIHQLSVTRLLTASRESSR